MEGDVPAATVADWAWRFADLGVQGLTICDTTGMASSGAGAAFNWAAGATRFDGAVDAPLSTTPRNGFSRTCSPQHKAVSSVLMDHLGDFGGCPYAPGASGNICSEDTINMLSLMGF